MSRGTESCYTIHALFYLVSYFSNLEKGNILPVSYVVIALCIESIARTIGGISMSLLYLGRV